jgi:hypothetical protein
VNCPVTVLEPEESTTCTAHYTVTAADVEAGFIANTAVATGGGARDETVTSPPAQAMLTIGPPRLTVTKRALTPAPHFRGTKVRFAYVVTNTGPRTVHALVVSDDQVAGVTCGITTLAPGKSTVCHGTYLVTAVVATARRVTNIAQAFGIDSHSFIASSDTVTVTIPVATGTPVTG